MSRSSGVDGLSDGVRRVYVGSPPNAASRYPQSSTAASTATFNLTRTSERERAASSSAVASPASTGYTPRESRHRSTTESAHPTSSSSSSSSSSDHHRSSDVSSTGSSSSRSRRPPSDLYPSGTTSERHSGRNLADQPYPSGTSSERHKAGRNLAEQYSSGISSERYGGRNLADQSYISGISSERHAVGRNLAEAPVGRPMSARNREEDDPTRSRPQERPSQVYAYGNNSAVTSSSSMPQSQPMAARSSSSSSNTSTDSPQSQSSSLFSPAPRHQSSASPASGQQSISSSRSHRDRDRDREPDRASDQRQRAPRDRDTTPRVLASPLSSPSPQSRASGYEGTDESPMHDFGRHFRPSSSAAASAPHASASSSSTASGASSLKLNLNSPPTATRIRTDSSSSPLVQSPILESTRPATSTRTRGGPPTLQVDDTPSHAARTTTTSHTIPTPSNSFGLMSPPLHRSISPERNFASPSAQNKRSARGPGPIAITPSAQQQTHAHALATPSSSRNRDGVRSNLGLRLDSSSSAILTNPPSSSSSAASNPRRSPPSSSAGGQVPNFVKGSLLTSPLVYDDFSGDEAELVNADEEEEGGIEILETIPYPTSTPVTNSLTSSSSNSTTTTGPRMISDGDVRLEEERGSRAAFKPKLKLKLSSSMVVEDENRPNIGIEGEDDDDTPTIQTYTNDALTSSQSADPYLRRSNGNNGGGGDDSPKNRNVFGLKLKLGNNDDDLTNSVGSTIQTTPSVQSSLSDSLTSSGRIALANFHASHALAMQSKRVPGGPGAARAAAAAGMSGGGRGAGGKGHRVNESYDVSQFGTLILDGFEIGSTGVQRTPAVEWNVNEGEDDLDSTLRRSLGASGSLQAAFAAEREREQREATAAMREHQSHASPSKQRDTLSSPASYSSNSSASSTGDFVSSHPVVLPLGVGGRRPSAVAAKLLTPSTHQGPGGSSTPSSGVASLGVEFRLSDMVRIGDLGVGQNGTVVKACHLPTLRIVALKVCTIFEKDERHQLSKELRAFNACNSSHIISFVGACFMEGRITMALEYMNRGDLNAVVKRQGPLSVPMIRNISKQVMKGLKHMHSRKCIHRDIKPANVLIDNDGNCKISDFGLLKQLDSTNAMASTFVGTMLYLSPERITGESFSYSSDIWSVGIMLIYLATGSLSLPKDYWALLNYVKGPPPSLDRTKFPSNLCDFVDACLTKDPILRPSAATLLKHPFLTTSDPPGTPLNQIWPFTTGKEPDEKEMELLVQAVIDRYYLTPAQVAAGMTPNSPSAQGKTIFAMNQADLQRIQSLAQQLAWHVRPLQDAFIRRLVARGSSLGGVSGEADEVNSPYSAGGVRSSNSFSAGVSGVSSSAAATGVDGIHRLKLSRQKSITLDHDPQFTGEFGGGNNQSIHRTTTNSNGSSNNYDISVGHPRHSPPSIASSPSPGLSASSASSSSARRNNNLSLHSSPVDRRRLDDTSSEDVSEDEPHSANASGRRARGAYSSATSFDSNAKIRAIRAESHANTTGITKPASAASSSASSSSPSTDRRPSASKAINVSLSLGAQLEDLMEDESD